MPGARWFCIIYPKDDTPGCTKETCAFRDNLPQFAKSKAAVFGISILDEASKARFAKKYDVTFPLLADGNHAVAEKYGAGGSRSRSMAASSWATCGRRISSAATARSRGAGTSLGGSIAAARSRAKAAGRAVAEQVVAANVDTIFLVTALDGGSESPPPRALSHRRAGRGRGPRGRAEQDRPERGHPERQASRAFGSAPAVRGRPGESARSGGEGLGGAGRVPLRRLETVALIGSSGVGKSTLVNALLGAERQRTADVREPTARDVTRPHIASCSSCPAARS